MSLVYYTVKEPPLQMEICLTNGLFDINLGGAAG